MKRSLGENIEAARQGDMGAFEELYHASAQKFRAYLYPMLKNGQDIEDVLQEAYVYIYQNLDKLKGAEAFFAWGTSICRNIALHHLRTAKRHWGKDEYRPMFSDEENEGMDAIPASDERGEYADPQVQMDAKETKRLLDEMIGGLPENQRICIVLWQGGLSMSEIAEQLDMPKGTVNSNINYAKKKIKDQVLLLEKQGTKLYNLAPIPFFLWVMSQFQEYGASVMPAGTSAAFLSVVEGLGHAAEAAGTAASSMALEPAAGTAGKAAAGAAAKAGTGKIAALVLAGCLAVGGGAALATANNRPAEEPAVQEELPEEGSGETAAARFPASRSASHRNISEMCFSPARLKEWRNWTARCTKIPSFMRPACLCSVETARRARLRMSS